jgi:hypothetical protein
VISADDFAFVIHGYRWVIIALIGTSLLALAASWFRPQQKEAIRREGICNSRKSENESGFCDFSRSSDLVCYSDRLNF